MQLSQIRVQTILREDEKLGDNFARQAAGEGGVLKRNEV